MPPFVSQTYDYLSPAPRCPCMPRLATVSGCLRSGSQQTLRWRKRDSNHPSRLLIKILQCAAEIDRKFEPKIMRCTVAKQVMAAGGVGDPLVAEAALAVVAVTSSSRQFSKFAPLPVKGRGSNPWSARLRAQLSRPAAGSPARHRDAGADAHARIERVPTVGFPRPECELAHTMDGSLGRKLLCGR
jgi:hypothetical protein